MPVERCAEFPDVCHQAVYCDGEPFCTSRRGTQAPTCGGEGYSAGEVACCPGLIARCGRVTEGTCDAEHGTDHRPRCMPCGDGVCSSLEQRCNCPEDCAVTPQRRKILYRGNHPEGPGKGNPHGPPRLTRPGQCLDTQRDPERLRGCMVEWARAVFGRDSVEELRDATSIEPFTAFDLDLMRCLELERRGRSQVKESSREACLEALALQTKDGRLDKLLRP
ncbi:hypothetical protein D7V93_16300 [Corallococcus llansteffanensis]|uniref:Uncharacterized protein n=1 Tax=Corallococcus llansteffanensis TaxID=2316731 RepID=A0A3A8PQG7_9BACT|nr:hypothetical protein D7V93_16300 [Corallococcus llansteffanensis]